MTKKKKSSDFKYGTQDYNKLRIPELENERDRAKHESDYYKEQLAKSHEILGRVIHQLSERWDTVNLTEFFPTDNLHRQRTISNPRGKKS